MFSETRLGNSLRLNTPLEYDMIVASSGVEPDADLIEAIGYASIDPYFRSLTFRKLLIKYRIDGCRVQAYKDEPTAEAKLRALQNRRKRLYGV